jgi:hypothetical protein
MPPDEHPDRPPDRRDNDGRPAGSGGVEAEPRSRQEYDADLRGAVSAEESAAARRISADEQATTEKWDEQSGESRWMWSEYQRKWPSGERPSVDRSDDPPGSWRGEGNRYLEPADNAQVEEACERVADEAFTTDLVWERSASLVSAERGDLLNDYIEITEDEANQIIDRIRAKVTGAWPPQ